jgi:hypothetical protein
MNLGYEPLKGRIAPERSETRVKRNFDRAVFPVIDSFREKTDGISGIPCPGVTRSDIFGVAVVLDSVAVFTIMRLCQRRMARI